MAYVKTDWKDRVVEKPRTFILQNNGDGTVTLVPSPGTVVEEGTPVNAANLNKIETLLEGLGDVTYEVATKVEAEAGASDVKYMTPLRVKEHFNNALNSPMGGDIVMYMRDGKILTDSLSKTSLTYSTYKKNIEVYIAVSGIYRVSFSLDSDYATPKLYGRIYKNGLPYGIERFVQDGVLIQFTEDLYFNKGDLLQLYSYDVGGLRYAINGFRISSNQYMSLYPVLLLNFF